MSNHHRQYQAANLDPSELQPGLASNPTYRLNELTRVERARLRLLIEAAHEPRPDPIVTFIGEIVSAVAWFVATVALALLGVWEFRHRIATHFKDNDGKYLVGGVVFFLFAGVLFYALAGVGSYLTIGGIR